jgi:6-phosphofructokinase 1
MFGFIKGPEGLLENRYIEITPELVDTHRNMGGFNMIKTGRTKIDSGSKMELALTVCKGLNLDALVIIGGDDSNTNAAFLAQHFKSSGIKVLGIPKTIDNDISYVQSSFGFDTAVSESRTAIESANTEANGAKNGIGLVKLMGRESGLIAAWATLANNDVNYCLVPEVPFTLDGLLKTLKERIKRRGHAVIVAGEGAGQNIIPGTGERDASGNIRFSDIGLFLKDNITGYFKKEKIEVNLKYIDPSYTIRSLPANPRDSAFCLLLGHHAVHAGMTGRTNMLVGFWKGDFTHVPISLATSSRKKIDPNGRFWGTVLSCTGQPREMI